MFKRIFMCAIILASVLSAASFAEVKAIATSGREGYVFNLYFMPGSYWEQLTIANYVKPLGEISFADKAAYEVNRNIIKDTNIPDGIIKAYYISDNNFNSNIISSWDKYANETNMVAELTFLNNKLNGISKIYSIPSSADKYMTTIMFVDDVASGEYKITKNEKVIKEGNYEGGALNGALNEFYDDGSKYKEANYVIGVLDGLYKEYDENKYIIQETSYKYGVILTSSTYEDDKLKKKVVYEDDQPKYTYEYNKNGKLINTIDNAKERGQGEKELAVAVAADNKIVEKIKSKLSEITLAYSYEDVVALLGEPKKDNMQQMVETYGNGYATWLLGGFHSAQISFKNRYCTSILLDSKPFRVFTTY